MKRPVALLMALLMLGAMMSLSACTSSDQTQESAAITSAAESDAAASTAASAITSTAATVKDGVITIGVDDSYPPMEYKDDSGNTVGFDVDMANEIGKRLGKSVEFVSTAWDGIFQALNTDKFDVIISSVSMTEERLGSFEFTKPYIANAQMIIVKPGDTSITKAEDLAGKTVGCQISTTANDSATYLIDKQGIQFTLNTYDTVIQPFQDMKAGRLDAIIVDEVVGQYYIATDPASFQSAAVNLTNEPIGCCFKKGNTALKDEIQQAIDAMVADGTMKTLSEKWFDKDLTSDIDESLKTLG